MFRPKTADPSVQNFELTDEKNLEKKIHICFSLEVWKKINKDARIISRESNLCKATLFCHICFVINMIEINLTKNDSYPRDLRFWPQTSLFTHCSWKKVFSPFHILKTDWAFFITFQSLLFWGFHPQFVTLVNHTNFANFLEKYNSFLFFCLKLCIFVFLWLCFHDSLLKFCAWILLFFHHWRSSYYEALSVITPALQLTESSKS